MRASEGRRGDYVFVYACLFFVWGGGASCGNQEWCSSFGVYTIYFGHAHVHSAHPGLAPHQPILEVNLKRSCWLVWLRCVYVFLCQSINYTIMMCYQGILVSIEIIRKGRSEIAHHDGVIY